MASDLSSGLTGDPPAVTAEQLKEWKQVANDIDSALKMGGEQGMELLLNIMADWCSVADEINTAYQICCDLADNGMRDEAIGWHASGFFEIADRLDPERPGWEQWEKHLTENGVILPTIDYNLKALVDGIFETLGALNLETGVSVGEEIKALRRNMISRGLLSERLGILHRLQALDPSNPIWKDMLRPYQKRRANELKGEVDALVKSKDCSGLCRLHREVTSQNWDGDLPAEITVTLESACNWRLAMENFGDIRHHSTEMKVRCREGEMANVGSPEYINAITKAREHRRLVRQLVKEVQKSIAAASKCHLIKPLVDAEEIVQKITLINHDCKDRLNWLAQQDNYDRWRARFLEIDTTTATLLSKKPRRAGLSFQDFKVTARRWIKKSEAHLLNTRKICMQAGDIVPHATERIIAELVTAETEIENEIKRVSRLETTIILGTIGGCAVFVGLIGLLIFLNQ